MPTFNPSITKTAAATISNPTARGFSYFAELYLGLPKKASSGKVSFSLAAGETKPVSFTIIMPSTAGTYPVYLDVYADSQLVGAYQATEDVVIPAPAPILLEVTASPEKVVPGQDITFTYKITNVFGYKRVLAWNHYLGYMGGETPPDWPDQVALEAGESLTRHYIFGVGSYLTGSVQFTITVFSENYQEILGTAWKVVQIVS